MKKIYLLFIILTNSIFAQQTIDGSIIHDGLLRTYKLYIPASYDSEIDVPLLFNFHGHGDNSAKQMTYGDFRGIADTANFIIVHPQGTPDSDNYNYFNVGLVASTVDDLGFTEALLDKLISEYSINTNKVYSTGMSLGGFMSLLIACQLSNRFTAVASVTGSMAPIVLNYCNPLHKTPILQIHGTADNFIPYNGTSTLESIPSVLSYWTSFNNCGEAINLPISNSNTSDSCTAQKTVYPSLCAEVVHYKVNDGGHTWPGTTQLYSFLGNTNQDFNASKEIWKFFRKYSLDELTGCTIAGIESLAPPKITISPNPSHGEIQISGIISKNQKLEIKDVMGKVVASEVINEINNKVDISHLMQGNYFVVINESVLHLIKE